MLEPRKVSPRRSFASVITGFGAILTVVLVPTTALAAPGNDSFHHPERITSIPFTTTQSTEGATTELDEPLPSCAPIANTVWFRFRSTTNQELNANTYGSDFDTVIAVYTGHQPATLSEVACSDDKFYGEGLDSDVTFTAARNTWYLFQVGGFAGDYGNLSFTLRTPPPPPLPPSNDDFDSAQEISALPFDDARSTAGAGMEADEPTACDLGSASVWYRLAPSTLPRMVTADTFGSTYDTVLAVYADVDGTMSGLQEVGCDDDSGADLQSQVQFLATPGATYYFQVGAYLDDGGGSLILHVE
jgi:hypothetical protein